MSSQPPTPLPTAFVAATATATDVVDNAAYTAAAASARSEDGYWANASAGVGGRGGGDGAATCTGAGGGGGCGGDGSGSGGGGAKKWGLLTCSLEVVGLRALVAPLRSLQCKKDLSTNDAFQKLATMQSCVSAVTIVQVHVVVATTVGSLVEQP